MPARAASGSRHGRQRILVLANTLLALLTAVLVTLSVAHALTLPLAVALLVLYALAGSFHSAAFDSSYGRFVSQADLPRASGMMMTSFALAQMFAPPLAAMLVGLPALLGHGLPPWLGNGVPFAFAADGLTFVVAGIVAGVLQFPPHPVRLEHARGSLADDVRARFRWILTRRPFLFLISFGSLANLPFAPLVPLLPLLARDRTAADALRHHLKFESVLALVNTAGGLGGVVGGVAVSALGIRARRKTM